MVVLVVRVVRAVAVARTERSEARWSKKRLSSAEMARWGCELVLLVFAVVVRVVVRVVAVARTERSEARWSKKRLSSAEMARWGCDVVVAVSVFVSFCDAVLVVTAPKFEDRVLVGVVDGDVVSVVKAVAERFPTVFTPIQSDQNWLARPNQAGSECDVRTEEEEEEWSLVLALALAVRVARVVRRVRRMVLEREVLDGIVEGS